MAWSFCIASGTTGNYQRICASPIHHPPFTTEKQVNHRAPQIHAHIAPKHATCIAMRLGKAALGGLVYNCITYDHRSGTLPIWTHQPRLQVWLRWVCTAGAHIIYTRVHTLYTPGCTHHIHPAHGCYSAHTIYTPYHYICYPLSALLLGMSACGSSCACPSLQCLSTAPHPAGENCMHSTTRCCACACGNGAAAPTLHMNMAPVATCTCASVCDFVHIMLGTLI